MNVSSARFVSSKLLIISFVGFGIFFVPSLAHAALTFPTTACDAKLADPTVHAIEGMTQEDGASAFKYGSNNNSFVSQDGAMLYEHMDLLFSPLDQNGNLINPSNFIRIGVMDASCNIVSAVSFGQIVNGENLVGYDTNSDTVSLDSQTVVLRPNGVPRYFWVETWDGVAGSKAATYSYMIDMQNPQNPTGSVDGNPEPSGKRPVIIIPGILGSELYNQNGDLIWANLVTMFFDVGDSFIPDNLALNSSGFSENPISVGNVIDKVSIDIPSLNIHRVILDTFLGLRNQLEQNGYSLNQSYFYFPYDWRLNLNTSRELLKSEIQKRLNDSGFHKVDIIAHSMGGLLVKDYIAKYGTDNVNKLIFVGTPQQGAPKAARTILEGDNVSIPWLSSSAMKQVAMNSPAVYELLPTQTYFSTYQGYISPYRIFGNSLDNYSDTKSFLLGKGFNSDLFYNAEVFAQNLRNADYSSTDIYNIIGCGNATEAAYQFDLFGSIGQMGYTSGDQTVPLPSSNGITLSAGHTFYKKGGVHSDLPSADGVRQTIVDILNGTISSHDGISTNSDFCKFKGKTLTWHSPVDVHVYDTAGNHSGPVENGGLENSIPGVAYDIIGHEKFIYLPTDQGQTYHIVANGQTVGTFDLLIGDNDNGADLSTEVFNDVGITASSTVDFDISALPSPVAIQLDKFGDGTVKDVPVDSSLTAGQQSDLVPPQTQLNLAGVAGQNGWYTSTTTVTLNATDDNAGVLYTKYSTDGGNTYQNYSVPFTISSEGSNEVKYYSVDKAGNDEDVQTTVIKIDKTAPEISTNYDLSKKIFVFSASDNLDPAPTISCTTTTCTAIDTAGNTTFLVYKQTSFPLALILVSVTYNGSKTTFLSNILVPITLTKSGILQSYSQTFYLKNQQILSIVYDPKTNQSIVYTLTSPGALTKQIVSGLKILQISTQQGRINTAIK